MFKLFNKVREEKNEVIDFVKDTTDQIETVRLGMKENREQMKEFFARTDESLYKATLSDDEIVQLHELLQRAKRDDRFKEKLSNIDIWCISHEAIKISCQKIKDKYEAN